MISVPSETVCRRDQDAPLMATVRVAVEAEDGCTYDEQQIRVRLPASTVFPSLRLSVEIDRRRSSGSNACTHDTLQLDDGGADIDVEEVNPHTRDSWAAQNLRVTHFLLAESAVMSSLAAFGTVYSKTPGASRAGLYHPSAARCLLASAGNGRPVS